MFGPQSSTSACGSPLHPPDPSHPLASPPRLRWDDTYINKLVRRLLRRILDCDEPDSGASSGIVFELSRAVPLDSPIERTIEYFARMEFHSEGQPWDVNPTTAKLRTFFARTLGTQAPPPRTYALRAQADAEQLDPCSLSLADLVSRALVGTVPTVKDRFRRYMRPLRKDLKISVGRDLKKLVWLRRKKPEAVVREAAAADVAATLESVLVRVEVGHVLERDVVDAVVAVSDVVEDVLDRVERDVKAAAAEARLLAMIGGSESASEGEDEEQGREDEEGETEPDETEPDETEEDEEQTEAEEDERKRIDVPASLTAVEASADDGVEDPARVAPTDTREGKAPAAAAAEETTAATTDDTPATTRTRTTPPQAKAEEEEDNVAETLPSPEWLTRLHGTDSTDLSTASGFHWHSVHSSVSHSSKTAERESAVELAKRQDEITAKQIQVREKR